MNPVVASSFKLMRCRLARARTQNPHSVVYSSSTLALAERYRFYDYTRKSPYDRKCGVALDEPNGKHDGMGYFHCDDGHGVSGLVPTHTHPAHTRTRSLTLSLTPFNSHSLNFFLYPSITISMSFS